MFTKHLLYIPFHILLHQLPTYLNFHKRCTCTSFGMFMFSKTCILYWQANCSRRGDPKVKGETGMEERDEDHIRREGRRETGHASRWYNIHHWRKETPIVPAIGRWLGAWGRDPFSSGSNRLYHWGPLIRRRQNEFVIWWDHTPRVREDYTWLWHADLKRRGEERWLAAQVYGQVSQGTEWWTTVWYW